MWRKNNAIICSGACDKHVSFLCIVFFQCIHLHFMGHSFTQIAMYCSISSCQTTLKLVFFFQLEKLTVAVLKEKIKQEGIASTGTKKADLIDAICAHYNIE